MTLSTQLKILTTRQIFWVIQHEVKMQPTELQSTPDKNYAA